VRVYKTPILTTEEQKVIGGKLSLRQFAYILGGGLISFSLSKTLYKFISLASVLIFAALFGVSLLFAFYKVRHHEMNLDRFLFLRLKYVVSQKEYKYGRS
jgi:hypothetical protein